MLRRFANVAVVPDSSRSAIGAAARFEIPDRGYCMRDAFNVNDLPCESANVRRGRLIESQLAVMVQD